MQNIRLHFSKTFQARWISHLDLMRGFTRALKKSRLDVWYTEGFHPHLYLMFALALPLGVESLCETVDIRLMSDGEISDIEARVNAGLPFGIEVFHAAEPVHKLTEIAQARYMIEFRDSGLSNASIRDAVTEVLAQSEIPVQRKNKKGIVLTEDIRPYILEPAVCVRENTVYCSVLLPAGNEKSINPNAFVDAVLRRVEREPDHILVKRTQILTARNTNFE